MHTICFRLGRYNPKQYKTIGRTRYESNHASNKRCTYHVYIYIIWTLPLDLLSGRSCRLLVMQWFWLGFLLFTWLIVFLVCSFTTSHPRNLDETLGKLSEEITQNKQKREEQEISTGNGNGLKPGKYLITRKNEQWWKTPDILQMIRV